MTEVEHGDTVYLCMEWEPPEAKGSYRGTTGEWNVAGIVTTQEDADLWIEPVDEDDDDPRRIWKERTLGQVEAFYTESLDR